MKYFNITNISAFLKGLNVKYLVKSREAKYESMYGYYSNKKPLNINWEHLTKVLEAKQEKLKYE